MSAVWLPPRQLTMCLLPGAWQPTIVAAPRVAIPNAPYPTRTAYAGETLCHFLLYVSVVGLIMLVWPPPASGRRPAAFPGEPEPPRRVARLSSVRYDFEAYSEASDKMYGVFLRHAPVVMAVSCDEAFLELAKGTDPMGAATEVETLFRLWPHLWPHLRPLPSVGRRPLRRALTHSSRCRQFILL